MNTVNVMCLPVVLCVKVLQDGRLMASTVGQFSGLVIHVLVSPIEAAPIYQCYQA